MAFPSIKIQIGADTSRLGRDLKKGESLVSSFGKFTSNAMLGVAAAAGAAAIKIGVDGVKAAIEDEAAAAKLAKTLENVTHATASQTKAVEDYISKTTLATGITDDELRPSLDRLVRSTKDVAKAQQLQKIALDVSAGTGKDLASVTQAIAKAYDGNFGALKRLGVTVDAATMKSKDFNKVQVALSKTFGGQMDASLKTHAGQIKLLTTRWGEMKEEIGYVLLDGLQPLMDWASGPEGKAFMNDFMTAFKDAAIATAHALPKILEVMKGIGKVAGGMGINFDTFMDPKIMAAAAAFRITPGPIQLKALAAIAAYAAAGEEMKTSAERKLDTVSQRHGGAGAVMSGGYMYAAESQSTVDWYGNRMTASQYKAYQKQVQAAARDVRDQRIVMNVYGATDPAATAKAVAKALNKAPRLGINTAALGTGS